MEKITAVILTYNRDKLLPRAIDSVLKQTFDEFELYILDNGSTDSTEEIVKEYCAKDERVKYYKRDKNHIGIELANSIDEILSINEDAKYCTFIDDDDFMDENALATLYENIQKYDADISSIGSKFYYSDGTYEDKYVYEGTYLLDRIQAMEELLKREKINSARGGKLYKKEVIKALDYPDKNLIRDIHREYRIMNRINKMVICGTPMFYFHRHDSNYSGISTKERITEQRLLEHLKANQMRTLWLSEQMPEIKEFVEYSEVSFMLSLYDRVYKLEVEACYYIAEQMKAFVLEKTDGVMMKKFYTDREKKIYSDMMEKKHE